ncbi:MAG: VOC family protein [Putridiphycobacter sp.]
MQQKLNIITLGVDDLSRALNFYEKGLGWKRSAKSQGDIVFFNLGGMTLALFPKDKLAEDAQLPIDPVTFSGITLAYNAKSEQEVTDVLKLVESLGAKIVKPAQKVFWGGFNGYFKDLDGHLFEVAFNPFANFDENDNLVM